LVRPIYFHSCCDDRGDLDFPNLPYLIDGNVKITQSKAILYYIGRKFNLMGKTPAEEAYVMMLCEEAHDMRTRASGLFYSPNGDSADERKNYAQTTLKEQLAKFEGYFTRHTSKFAVGDQPTVADFQVFDYIDAVLLVDETNTLIDEFPHTKRFLQTIRELPELKDYIVDSQSKLPINNKGEMKLVSPICTLTLIILVAKFGGNVLQRK
jgi:glutathione S-transferase